MQAIGYFSGQIIEKTFTLPVINCRILLTAEFFLHFFTILNFVVTDFQINQPSEIIKDDIMNGNLSWAATQGGRHFNNSVNG